MPGMMHIQIESHEVVTNLIHDSQVDVSLTWRNHESLEVCWPFGRSDPRSM
jgi:hypothetical protein